MTYSGEFTKLRAEYINKHKGAQDPHNYLSMGFKKLVEVLKAANGKEIVFTPIEGTTGGQTITYK